MHDGTRGIEVAKESLAAIVSLAVRPSGGVCLLLNWEGKVRTFGVRLWTGGCCARKGRGCETEDC